MYHSNVLTITYIATLLCAMYLEQMLLLMYNPNYFKHKQYESYL